MIGSWMDDDQDSITYESLEEKAMAQEEILFIKVTPPKGINNPEVWYVHVPNREQIEKQIVNLFRSYSEGYKIEVLECNINHCTKADVTVNW